MSDILIVMCVRSARLCVCKGVYNISTCKYTHAHTHETHSCARRTPVRDSVRRNAHALAPNAGAPQASRGVARPGIVLPLLVLLLLLLLFLLLLCMSPKCCPRKRNELK